ncbi:oligopeptide/dipeptide ABC transporter ATP-binding protein, partial [Bradyrhizobium japonicum]|uniref:oligopeptide/dipeptide ABC transporter ATP-binding protein n=1 Tax=Bradyrhizobium japonicum TaxID=375 RepID=UPI0013648AF8
LAGPARTRQSGGLHRMRTIGHRVAVMYLGRIVELAQCEALFSKPVHPYTEALIAAAPVPNPTRARLEVPLEGEIPSPINPPSGCTFHPRCPLAVECCRVVVPPLVPMPDGRVVACHVRAPATEIPAQPAAAEISSPASQPQISLLRNMVVQRFAAALDSGTHIVAAPPTVQA